MSLLFDPLYPTQVQYVVSQSIWELYEIHFWQLLTKSWGKDRVFLYLQHRYEKKHRETPAIIFMILVFAITYLIQFLLTRYHSAQSPQTENANTEAVNDQNQNQNQEDGNQNPENEVVDDNN